MTNSETEIKIFTPLLPMQYLSIVSFTKFMQEYVFGIFGKIKNVHVNKPNKKINKHQALFNKDCIEARK